MKRIRIKRYIVLQVHKDLKSFFNCEKEGDMAADSWEMAGEQQAPYNQLQLSGMGGRTEASFKNSTALVKRPAVMPTRLAHSFLKHWVRWENLVTALKKVHLLLPMSWRAVA